MRDLSHMGDFRKFSWEWAKRDGRRAIFEKFCPRLYANPQCYWAYTFEQVHSTTHSSSLIKILEKTIIVHQWEVELCILIILYLSWVTPIKPYLLVAVMLSSAENKRYHQVAVSIILYLRLFHLKGKLRMQFQLFKSEFLVLWINLLILLCYFLLFWDKLKVLGSF